MSSPVSRVLSWTVIHLGPASPQASSNLPESSAGHAIGFLFGLAPGGVYHRRELLPVTRCALTAPFHPYRRPKALRRSTFCCTFRRLTPPRRYLAPRPAEPGLSSPSGLAATVWRARARQYPRSRSGASKTVPLPPVTLPSMSARADTARSSDDRSVPRQFWPPSLPATRPSTDSAAYRYSLHPTRRHPLSAAHRRP